MNSAVLFHAFLVSMVLSLGMFNASYVYANDEMWEKLSEGGKVVLMRHASVRREGNPLLRDPSCQEERNLSDEGRSEARVIGKRFRERSILISDVRHSPFCRTTDTARIAFGSGTPADFLSLLEILGPDEAVDHTEQLSSVIGSYIGEGNLVLITHEPNIRAVSFELLRPLDLLVLQPEGGDGFEELGVVRWDASN